MFLLIMKLNMIYVNYIKHQLIKLLCNNKPSLKNLSLFFSQLSSFYISE